MTNAQSRSAVKRNYNYHDIQSSDYVHTIRKYLSELRKQISVLKSHT